MDTNFFQSRSGRLTRTCRPLDFRAREGWAPHSRGFYLVLSGPGSVLLGRHCAQSLFPMTTQAFMHHEAPREHTRPASAAKAQAGAGPHKVSLKQATVQAERRFPPPWEVHEATESFCIRDNDLAVASNFELLIAFTGNKPIGRRPQHPDIDRPIRTENEATTTSEPRVPNAARGSFLLCPRQTKK